VNRYASRIALAASLILAAGASPLSAAPTAITIATGPVSGFAFPLGGAICRAVERESHRKTRCSLLATDGSLDDLERLRDGEANFAIVQSDIAGDAVAATGAFNGKPALAALRGVAGFYSEVLTIIVRADGQLNQVEDLKGKRIVIGEPNMPDPLFGDFLEALGWSKADLGGTVEMPRSEQIAALCAGTVAAIAVTAPNPNGFVRSALDAKCPLTILDLGAAAIDSVTGSHPAYAPARVDLGVYTGQPRVINSFGPRAVLVTLSGSDGDTVKDVMAAVDKDMDDLRKSHPGFAGLDRAAIFSSRGLGAERHDAANQYLIDHRISDSASGE
jgi:TRAP transporter TAXI family solute receptor